jgi:hypothetical protein
MLVPGEQGMAWNFLPKLATRFSHQLEGIEHMAGGERPKTSQERQNEFINGLRREGEFDPNFGRDPREYAPLPLRGQANLAGQITDAMPEPDEPPPHPDEYQPPPQPPQERDPLDDIAALVRSLTYGKMMELASELWNARGDTAGESRINQEHDLPSILHRWAAERNAP